jgi:hypothetical protein
MRFHYAIGIAVVLVVGFGMKMFFFSAPTAQATQPSDIMDVPVLEAKIDMKAMPEQAIASEADPDLQDNSARAKQAQ